MLRRATVADVPAISRIITESAEFGLMLPKPMARLYETVRAFQVATQGDSETSEVVGCCALSIIWADLAEVASLAVSSSMRGRGLGKKLVQACVDEAHQLGIRRVMTLTYEQAFFEKLGFAVVDRQDLPHKVWAECVACPKRDACDEIAMLRVFDDLPPVEVRPPDPGYDVPVALRVTRKTTLT